ncbi:MAG: hypothetical protein ABI352_11675 [Candidatus Dormibacter sp.]
MASISRRATAAAAAALAVVICGCGSSTAGSASPTSSGSASGTPPPSASPAVTAHPVSTPAGVAAPAGFVPVSVTFVSSQMGWVLGRAPCSSSSPCLTLLRTQDAGRSWLSVPAPPSTLSSSPNPGGHGVRGVRFADALDGWAFGPELWATHDGGGNWTRITLPGASSTAAVVDLAAAAGEVHAAVFDHSVAIDSSPIDHEGWGGSSTTIPFGAGPVPRARMVLQGTGGWLVEVDRTVVGGARLSAGQWSRWGPPCPDGGGDAIVDASSVSNLVAVCNEGVWNGGTPATHAYLSSDGGDNFAQAATTLPVGNADEVATPAAGRAVVAAHSNGGAINELLATGNGGASWSVVFHSAGTEVANDLGFTTVQQGVVVESDGASAAMLMTFDSGQHWSPVSFH